MKGLPTENHMAKGVEAAVDLRCQDAEPQADPTFFFNFSITVDVPCYFILVSGVPHSG